MAEDDMRRREGFPALLAIAPAGTNGDAPAMRRHLLLALAGLLAVAACDSKTDDKKDAKGKADDKKGDKKGDAKTAAKTDAKADAKADEPAAAGGAIVLEKLGLKAEAPAGATVSDGIGGAGVMIQAPGVVVLVDAASETRPKTVDDAKKDADSYTPKNLKDEKLADGWIVTYDNEGTMGKNFFVNVRRDIGGKAIWCETTASAEDQAAAAIAICKSLAPK